MRRQVLIVALMGLALPLLAEEIQRFIPGTDSGTFDYFVEAVFDGEEAPILSASNTQLSEDDNVLVQGVLGSPYAIGFFGYAYYAENTDVLRVLSIEGVEPTAEAVDQGEYLLARPLFIYSTAEIMKEKPQVASLIDFYLSHVDEEIVDVACFPASVDALRAVPRALREAAYGLGATRLEVAVKVVVSAALSGIAAAFIVAISRALGETMIVAIAAGAGSAFTLSTTT